MTTPAPRAVGPGRPVPAGKPVAAGRPVQGRPAQSGGGSNAANAQVSPLSVVSPSKPRLLPRRERILMAGDSNSGKTYAYFVMAWNEFADPGNRDASGAYIGPKFFLLDTDDTSGAYMGEGEQFEPLYFENGGNVYPYPAFDWNMTRAAIAGILADAKRGDWIIVDLISRVYDQARDYIAALRGIDRSDSAITRSLNQQGFGEGDVGFWNLASITHDSVSNRLLQSDSVAANILCLAHTTDMVDGREKRETAVLFDGLGIKPKGRPQIPGQMNTVVVLWSRVVLTKDGNRVTGRKTERFMEVVKDRGQPCGIRVPYSEDWWSTFKEARLTMPRLENVQPGQRVEDGGDLEVTPIDTANEVSGHVDAPAMDLDEPLTPNMDTAEVVV